MGALPLNPPQEKYAELWHIGYGIAFMTSSMNFGM
jgi:hypothetical protein